MATQLNKFLAFSGVCSRRKAVELIKQGLVTINGQKVLEPWKNVHAEDLVRVRGKLVTAEKKIYILLNKPKDYITTVSDQSGRKTVLDLLGSVRLPRISPVGRLDRNTTGLLLLTNDGDLAQQLSHPKYGIQKVYRVRLDKPLRAMDANVIADGVKLPDGMVLVDEIMYTPGKKIVQITLHSGKYRVVRRLFEHFDYKVEKLDRVCYAGLTKTGLKNGAWRYLTKQEIEQLKNLNKLQKR